MLLSPYAAQGLGSGLSKVLEQKLQQKYFKDKLIEQEESLKRQNEFQMQAMKDKYNFYKSQIEPYLGEIVKDKNASGLLANIYARTGSLPVSQFIPKKPQPIIKMVGDTLVSYDPITRKATPIYKADKKKEYKYIVVDGNIAVLDDGKLVNKYPIAKKREKGNYTIYETKPFVAKNGKTYRKIITLDKTTGKQTSKFVRVRETASNSKKSNFVQILGKQYPKEIFNAAVKMADDYYNPDYFGDLEINGKKLTPEEAAMARAKIIVNIADFLMLKRNESSNPSGQRVRPITHPPSVFDPKLNLLNNK